MKFCSLLLLLTSTSVFAQYQFSNPIELSGTVEGARTIHFSDDGTRIFGDWDELTEWNIQSQSIVKSSPITGYNTNKSAFNGQSTWMNANVNYNTDKKDIADTHPNINVINTDKNSQNRTEKSYGLAAFIPGTSDVIIVAMSKEHTYGIVRLNTASLEESTVYFDENKDGTSVPTSIKVSPDGKLVAIAMAGEKSGTRICTVKDGSLVRFIPMSDDVNDLAFSQDGKFLFLNNGGKLIQLKTSDWTREKAWQFSSPISSLDVNSTGSYVAFSFQGAGAILVDTKDGAVLAQLSAQKVTDIAFSNNDRYVAVGIQKTLKSEEAAAVVLYEID